MTAEGARTRVATRRLMVWSKVAAFWGGLIMAGPSNRLRVVFSEVSIGRRRAERKLEKKRPGRSCRRKTRAVEAYSAATDPNSPTHPSAVKRPTPPLHHPPQHPRHVRDREADPVQVALHRNPRNRPRVRRGGHHNVTATLPPHLHAPARTVLIHHHPNRRRQPSPATIAARLLPPPPPPHRPPPPAAPPPRRASPRALPGPSPGSG